MAYYYTFAFDVEISLLVGTRGVGNLFYRAPRFFILLPELQTETDDMIRPIIHDPLFLALPSDAAGEGDRQIITDLRDTLMANRDRCVGMAANMIGERKRIIVFFNGPFPMVMVNPRITGKSGEYETEEGCLSLSGVRKTKRWKEISVSFQDENFQMRKGSFSGFPAQIIQHECDHCDGILI